MRTRFTAEELAFFTPGTDVEWRSGRHWHLATVAAPFDADSVGRERIRLTNHAATRHVYAGQTIYGYPGNVRLPAGWRCFQCNPDGQLNDHSEPVCCTCGCARR